MKIMNSVAFNHEQVETIPFLQLNPGLIWIDGIACQIHLIRIFAVILPGKTMDSGTEIGLQGCNL